MAHYLFIHGAWHGSWCWDKISSHLKAKDCRFSTIDLPGRGINPLPFNKITLATHVDHLLKIISSIEEEVILVAHSMGGLIASQVAEEIPHRIKKIIYIAGFLPQNGDSLISLSEKYNHKNTPQGIVIDFENHCISVEKDAIANLFYHCSSKTDIDHAKIASCKEAYLPFIGTVSLSEKYYNIPKLYIQCTLDKAITIEAQKSMCERVPCDIKVLETDHSPFFSEPEKLVNLIL